jgi:acetyltransferase-like isoleucine patch superfamily enzyme
MGELRIPDRKRIDPSFCMSEDSLIVATSAKIGKGVRIGKRVRISCDLLVIGNDVRIGDNAILLCPDIRLGNGCQIESDLEAEMNEYFRLGDHCVIGPHARVSGQGLESGQFLRMNENVTIGGGGARGPRSYLTIGDYSRIVGNCYINLSEPVQIGSHTALSRNVTILTHGAWQPALMGFPAQFGPVRIGENSVLYVNAQVMPNVSIGNFCTVAAGAIVTKDIPDNCLAAGIPATIRRGPENYPHPLTDSGRKELLIRVLRDYLTTLPGKGIEVVGESLLRDGTIFLRQGLKESVIRYLDVSPSGPEPDISLSLVNAPGPLAPCHFDLSSLKTLGTMTELSEDLRDHLRRWAIRVETGQPYQALPLTNLSRLKQSLQRE